MPTRTRSSPAEPATAPPAYFLSLTVENVRCFGPAQTLDLSDGKGRPARWTVLLGENGVGKSTLLQCLVAVESKHYLDHAGRSYIIPRLGAPTLLGGITLNVADFLRGPSETIRLHGHIAFGTKMDSSAPPQHRDIKVSYTIMQSERYPSGSTSVHPFEQVGGLVCYAYGPFRRIDSNSDGRTGAHDPVASLFLANAPLRDAEAWWLGTDYSARLDFPNRMRFERYALQVKEALIYLLPDVADLRIIPPRNIGDRPMVEAQTSFGWVPLRRLGSGYQSQIAWVVDLASRLFERYPDSDDPLAEPAVVLVDEIDLHMHPRWQRDIVRYLTERLPNTQFIVTAHSPLIVQAAEDANLVLLRREGDHVVIDNDPVRLRNWRVDQILTSELFGLESARPPQVDGLLSERRDLLSKGRLSANDRRRLAALDAEIGELPAGESVEDSQAMEIIRRAAARLRDQGGA